MDIKTYKQTTDREFRGRYIECAGLRVPLGWTPQELAAALAKRKIRFHKEQEVMEVVGNALILRSSLEADITSLQDELRALEKRKARSACPKCVIPTANNIKELVQPKKRRRFKGVPPGERPPDVN